MFVTFALFLCALTVGRAAMLSIGVAQSICIQQRRFERGDLRGVLQGPLKAPLTRRKYDDCHWISWDADCRGKDTKSCPIFSRNSCQIDDLKTPESSARIVGGKEVVPYSYPSYVHLTRTADKRSSCGATIIHKNWVITAQHCVRYIGQIFFYYVVAGRHSRSTSEEGEQSIGVDRWIFHPNLPGPSGSLEEVDVALLHLEKPLNFTDNIQPALLPTQDYPTGDLTVVGKGITDANKSSNVVREVSVPIISLEKCREVAGPKEPINDWEICLYEEREIRGTCSGDSGGPGYFIENDPEMDKKKSQVLVGVISFKIGECYLPGLINGLISVSRILDWIKDNIKD